MKNETDPMETFDMGYHEFAKEQHKKRVADNPSRIQYAIEQFKKHNIEFTLKNEQTGHFHCRRKSDDKLFQFYAGTGKIMGYNKARGIHALIKLLDDDRNERCRGYCGVACVDGSCPAALRDEYAERRYPIVTDCSECFYYEGCEDCCFEGTIMCEHDHPSKKNGAE